MRAIVQRVSRANCKVDGEICAEIDDGLLVLLAVTHNDGQKAMKWLCNKIVNLRVFPDDENKMNRSVLDINGGILLISNFTLYGDVKKGFRPNFMKAAKPETAEKLYNDMIQYMKESYSIKIASGVFGAMMDIELINAGPVTISIEKEEE